MRLKFFPAKSTDLTGAKIVDAETGEEIEDVVCVTYRHRAGNIPTLTVEVINPLGDLDLVHGAPEAEAFEKTSGGSVVDTVT